jgi:hypothetical protein
MHLAENRHGGVSGTRIAIPEVSSVTEQGGLFGSTAHGGGKAGEKSGEMWGGILTRGKSLRRISEKRLKPNLKDRRLDDWIVTPPRWDAEVGTRW